MVGAYLPAAALLPNEQTNQPPVQQPKKNVTTLRIVMTSYQAVLVAYSLLK